MPLKIGCTCWAVAAVECTQMCACVLTRMSHERSKNIDGTELLKYYFDSRPPYWSSLPLGSIGPSGIWRCYARPLWVWLQNEAKWIGIHMNTWTHGNSTSCVLLFPSTMRSCECPERWPIPARRSRTELTHSCHLLIRCLSGDSTSREAMDWRMHLWFRGAGGREAYFFPLPDREWWKSHLQVQYISVHLSIMYRPSLMNLGCQWFGVGSWLTCVSCAKRIWESQTVHAVHKFQHQSILMFRLIIYDIIEHDIMTLYMTILYYTSNVIIGSFHLRNKDNKACPSWKFLRCHMVSPSNVPCDVSFPPSAANPNRCCEDPNRWRRIHRAPA